MSAPEGAACWRCKRWIPSLFTDGAGLCGLMVEAAELFLGAHSDFSTGINWALEHLRTADDRCARFEEKP